MVEVPYKHIHVVPPSCLKFVQLRIFRWQILSGALPFAWDCFNRMGGKSYICGCIQMFTFGAVWKVGRMRYRRS